MDNEQNEREGSQEKKSFFGIIVHSFFVIPFLIAVFCVLLFTAIHLLTREQQTVYDFLKDIKTGGETKRWQAAFELSKILANPQLVPTEERFVNEMVFAYQRSVHDDNRVRQYLALAMGRSGKREFLNPLMANIHQEKEENLPAVIYALGMLRDKRALPTLNQFINHQNSRIRSLVVVSLGNIKDLSSKEILKKSLSDPEPNVQWGAALSLAQLGDSSGEKIIQNLLSRRYLESFPEVDPQEQNHLMLSAIQAASLLDEKDFDATIHELAQSDKNMKVKAAAMDYFGGKLKAQK